MQINRTVIDQMEREVTFSFPPKRIISLVPSQTELLFDLGLKAEVIGITKFCVHPNEWFKTKTRIGGTKKFHFDKIAELKPDLLIGNKEENEQEQIEELARLYPVWMSDIKSLDDALEMMVSIGDITDKREEAQQQVQLIKNEYSKFEKNFTKLNNTVAYFIWKDPWMLAGGDTFINYLLEEILGFNNLAKELNGRYPKTNLEELVKLNPEYVLLSSEPFPFKEAHIKELKNSLPESHILLVDGELFSWYGSRLKYSFDYFMKLFSTNSHR